MSARIICGFPGVGKTSLFNNQTKLSIKVLDSDSSLYSWTTDENGNKVRNPNFPNNYIEHITSNMDFVDVILVSTHREVLDALNANGLADDVTIVYPAKKLKEDYLERYSKRGSDSSFIELMNKNFDSFVSQLENDGRFLDKIKLTYPTMYLSDVV